MQPSTARLHCGADAVTTVDAARRKTQDQWCYRSRVLRGRLGAVCLRNLGRAGHHRCGRTRHLCGGQGGLLGYRRRQFRWQPTQQDPWAVVAAQFDPAAVQQPQRARHAPAVPPATPPSAAASANRTTTTQLQPSARHPCRDRWCSLAGGRKNSLASVSAETIAPCDHRPVAESADLPLSVLPMSTIAAAAPPVNSPSCPAGQPDRHHHRILRFLHLRHGRRAGVPAPVLPGQQRAGGPAAVTGDLRGGVHRPAGRLGGVWSFRRPHRPQGHPGRRVADHGPVHGADRPAADPCADRAVGTGAAGAVPLRPRAGAGRRMGWGGAAGHRECATGQARLVRHVPAAGRAHRFPAVGRHLPGAGPLPEPGRLPAVGLAYPVRGQRVSGRPRPVGAPEHPRDARFQEGAGAQGAGAAADVDGAA